MQIQLFTIQAIESREQINELNAFLRSHKIIDMEKQFVTNGNSSFWSFCVRYTLGSTPMTFQTRKEKIDYKEVLSEEHFMIFSRLRQIRKQLAESDAVPAYAVFTDENLSNIARLDKITTSNLLSVKGIGEKKIEKYGNKIVNILNEPTV